MVDMSIWDSALVGRPCNCNCHESEIILWYGFVILKIHVK